MSKTTIFLSSTIDDMKKERNAIGEVVNTLGQNMSRCEYYPARSKSPKEVCLTEAASCDIFIGVYKNRYGNIPTESNFESISVTEMEYKKAKEAKRPLLLFIHANAKNREPKLAAFLKKIKNFPQGHYVKVFKNNDELKYLVLHSLVFQLLNSSKFEELEIQALENLLPDLTNYKKAFLQNYSFDSASGIVRASIPLDYSLNDLFIPPKLTLQSTKQNDEYSKYGSLQEMSPMWSFWGFTWNEIENFVKKEDKNQITTGINIKDTLRDFIPAIILGGAGIGKSTLLKYFCCHLISNSPIIPIFIQIREFMNFISVTGNSSILEFLAKKYQDMNLTQNFFLTSLDSGSCIIVFDGLDEVWDIEDRKLINDILQQFCSIWSSKNKIFISSRKEGYDKNPLSIPNQKYQIEGFDKNKIHDFVHNWVKIANSTSEKKQIKSENIESANKILGLIGENDVLSELASYPLLLQIICLVFYKNPIFSKRKHNLYSNLIETIFSRWEERKGIKHPGFDWMDVVKILKKIAYFMYKSHSPIIVQNDLIQVINNSLTDEGITEYTRSDVKYLIQRLEERAGLLNNDGQGNYSFSHLTFQEYFTALELAENHDPEKIFESLKAQLHFPINSEIISFLGGILSDKSRISSSKLLEKILNANTKYEKIHGLDLLLVIKCLADGTYVSDSTKSKIFSSLNTFWDEKRNKDNYAFEEIIGLFYSPYEKNIVEIWHRKCSANFAEGESVSSLSSQIFSDPKYKNFLNEFCKKLSSRNIKANLSLMPLYFALENNPHDELIFQIQRIFEKIKHHPVFKDIAYFIALKAITNKNYENWYFEKLEKEKNIKIKFQLLKFAVIINKLRTKKYMNKLRKKLKSFPDSDVLDQFDDPKNNYRHEKRMKLIQEILDNKKNSDKFLLTEINLETMTMNTLDAEFLNALLNILISHKLSIKIQSAICHGLDLIYDLNPDSREIICGFINKVCKENPPFRIYLQDLEMRINQPNQENKKILIKAIKNSSLSLKTRASLHAALLDIFFDEDVRKIHRKYFNQPEFTHRSLWFLYHHPEIIEEFLPNLIKMYNHNNLQWEEQSVLLLAIRNYFSIKEL